MKPRDPNRSDFARVVESMSVDGVAVLMDADDEAAEIAIQTCAVPTDSAN